MKRPFGQGSEKDETLRPRPADWPGRARVRPSRPFGDREPSDQATGERLDVTALYKNGEAAKDRGETVMAIRYFERITALYALLDDDPSLLTGELAWALHRVGELMARNDSYGGAAERFFAAGDVFERLATTLSAEGKQELAGQMEAAARDARRRGAAAQAASGKVQARAQALALKRGDTFLRP